MVVVPIAGLARQQQADCKNISVSSVLAIDNDEKHESVRRQTILKICLTKRQRQMVSRCWRGWIAAIYLPASAYAAIPAVNIPWIWDRNWSAHAQAVEVALLVDNLELRGNVLRQRPRLQSPPIFASTLVTPVVHVEYSLLEPPLEPGAFNDVIRDRVLAAASRSTSGWVQLDFEARPSGREAYLRLVHSIRQLLPERIRLSVTVLAWWCQGGAWLDTLDADEVVPMFFRMGRDASRLRALLQNTPAMLHPRCSNGAIGLSRQEPQLNNVTARYARRYWFDYKGWKEISP